MPNDRVAGRARAELMTPKQNLINAAIEMSKLSPCRSKRGSVIFRGDDLVSQGYNFKPRGFDCDGTAECKATCRIGAIHAEQFALLMAGLKAVDAEMLHVKTVDGKLVPSGGPSCAQCSKLALAVGVKAMWLYHADGWRRYDAVEWHRLSLLAGLGETVPRGEQGSSMTELPRRTRHRLATDMRQRADSLSGERWEVPATAAMMHEAADWLDRRYPTPDMQLEGDDERVAAIVGAVRGGFSTTGGDRPVFERLVSVESVVRFVLLRAEAGETVPSSQTAQESRLRIALRTVFVETGAEAIEVHSGDREPGHYITREQLLAADVLPASQTAWQPIATAPKDGTNILVWDGFDCMVSSFIVLGQHDGHDFGEWATQALCAEEPTHWQRLPAAPVLPAPASVHAETFDELRAKLDQQTPGLSKVAEALHERMKAALDRPQPPEEQP